MNNKVYKPIFYYSVMTSNRGDSAIRKSIVDAISKNIDVPFSFFNLKTDELTEERIIKQVNKEASMLMIAGSGLYTNYPLSSGWYFPCKTKLFSKITVPIVLFGIGSNNNLKGNIVTGDLKPKTKKSIKLINSLSTISTVRDKRTFNLLNELGIRHHKLILDSANFLDIDNTVKKEHRVAINVAQHSPVLGRWDGDGGIREKNIKIFTKICKYLTAFNYSIVFIAHDALEQSLIIDLKKNIPNLEYINTDDIDTMLKEYQRCQFSIGVKMHSNILSFAAGTPFLSLFYDVKSMEYMDLIKHRYGIGIFVENDELIRELFKWLGILNSSSYIENLQKQFILKKKKYKEEFDREITNICDIIKKG